MPKIVIGFQIQSSSLDATKEPRPRLVFTCSRSCLRESGSIAFPSFEKVKDNKTTHQVTVELTSSCKGAKLVQTAFFCDLFADTKVSLGPVTRSIGEERASTDAKEGDMYIPCRRFVARAIWTLMDMAHGATIAATDMAKSSKFSLTFVPEACRVDNDDDVRLVDYIGRFPESKQWAEEGKKQDEQLVEWSKSMALRANRRFGEIPSCAERLWTFNTSYVDAIYSPVGTPLRPIPGWVDLRHLRAISDQSHKTPPAFFENQLRWACARMNVDTERVLKDWRKTSIPVLALETVCDSLTHMACRSIYLHDTVVTLAKTKPVDVDDYKFPRLVDEYARAGDDCESLSKETLLLCMELERLSPKECEGYPLTQLARSIVRKYTWYQITGAITDDEGRLGCHSWVMAFPNGLNRQFIQRKEEKHHRRHHKKKWPVLVLESTDSTTSTSWEYAEEQEKERVQAKTLLHSSPISDALRFKTPASLMKQNCRYAYLSAAVTWQNRSQYKALEFMFCHHDPETSERVHGAPFQAVMNRRHQHEVELCPTVNLTDEDICMADRLLDWYPPIPTLRYLAVPSPLSSSLPTLKRGQFLTFLRNQDWDNVVVRHAWEDWCKEKHVSFEVLPTVMECEGVETIYLLVKI